MHLEYTNAFDILKSNMITNKFLKSEDIPKL